jgi:MraZ protein
MRRKGRIEDLALFVGVGATFEVWNPRAAAAEGGPHLKDIALYWLEERGLTP